jgi:hypothetical protein
MRLTRAIGTAVILFASGCAGANSGAQVNFQQQATSIAAFPASAQRVTLTSTGGYGGTITIPTVTSGAGSMLSITAQTAQPQGVPSVGVPALFFISFTLANDATQPAFQITLPAPVVNVSYYLAYFDPDAGWQLAIEGPATISGSTVTFAPTPGPVAWGAGEPYWYALYQTNSTGG